MSNSYNSKLRDARWQRKRLEIMQRDKWTCQSCGAVEDDGLMFNVHHAYYESGKNPWEYPDESLVTWCEDCHKERHETQIKINTELCKHSMYSLDNILHYIESISNARCGLAVTDDY